MSFQGKQGRPHVRNTIPGYYINFENKHRKLISKKAQKQLMMLMDLNKKRKLIIKFIDIQKQENYSQTLRILP